MMAMVLVIPTYLGDSRHDKKSPKRIYTIQKKSRRGNKYD